MKRTLQIAFLFFAGVGLAACSPARTGVVGNTLTTNERPSISITANPPLALADAGRVWATPRGDMMTTFGSASFTYAVYTEKNVSPARIMAYAAIIRLEDRERWAFQPQTNIPNTFGSATAPDYNGKDGTGYTLRVPAEGDWGSELLAANGTPPPPVWLAKRWIFAVDTNTRAIAEYREPWPNGFEAPGSNGVVLMSDTNAEALRAFEARAEKAFLFSTETGTFTAPQPGVSWKVPCQAPNIGALAGEVMYLEFHNDGSAGFN